jgi:hypothetical protein
LDLPGLVNSIDNAAIHIDLGRKGFANIGKEREGRISYEYGIARAMTAFQEARASADPQTLILAEYTFITQEFQLCEKNDTDTRSSLTKATEDFDDAFLALQAVEESGYKTADKTYPHNKNYRVSGLPKDAFHIACIAHRTRLQNILRSPGIDPIDGTIPYVWRL